MDKKINLEHTIRVVVAESLGAGVTTDKYVRTGNSFFKSVHIEPKKGDEHVPLNGAVRTGRNVQKERSSETMREEEQIDENAAKLLVKGGELLAKTLGYADDAAELAAKKQSKEIMDKLKFPSVEKTDNLPAVVTKPATKAADAKPQAVTKPEVKTETPPAPKLPEVKTQTKTETPTLPKLPEPKAQTQTQTSTATTTATKDAKPVKIELPNSQVKPSSKTQEMMKRINRLKDENNDDDRKEDKKEDKKRKPFGFPSISISREPINALRGYVPVNPYMHFATDRRTFGEEINPKDAEEIKVKTRKAQIIRKIIDEQKKKKDTSTVNLHPKLKNQEPDQN